MTSTQKTILIVWHSRTGAARQLAQAAEDGARRIAAELHTPEALRLIVKKADAVAPEDLLAADGYLFCAPENLAALSGAMKEFFDSNYYAVLDQLNGRPYGLLISAGSDGTAAARQAERICTGWRLVPIAPTLIANVAAQTAEAILAPKQISNEHRKAADTMGGTLAALLL
ncbi:flavodoxin family protein [Alcaligenaceae bacterium]|nr:flavodoxin family protein [Alcaligenaceae bacterium]